MKWIISALLLAVLLSGCSYSVYSNSLPHLKTVMITSFENESDEFELEEEIKKELISRFDKDGRLRVVTLQPDCLIEGTIMDYSRKIDTYDEQGIEEYNIRILFKISFTDLTRDEVIWQKDSLILSEVYSENSETALFKDEEAARNSIYEKLFLEIMKNTLEQW